MIQELLKNQHIIKGKKVDCKLAIPKEKIENISSSKKKKKKKKRSSSKNLLNKKKKRLNDNNNNSNQNNNKSNNKKNIPLYMRKMFVGGLHPSLNVDSLKNYFSQFGKIDKAIIMKDKITGRSRGFGFIIFSEKETIDKILSHTNCHFLYGKWIECKRAQPKVSSNANILDNFKN